METEELQDVLDVPVSAVPGFTEAAAETTETVDASPDTLLEKPFDDYTVTEGLLLIIALLLFLSLLMRAVKEGFHWL